MQQNSVVLRQTAYTSSLMSTWQCFLQSQLLYASPRFNSAAPTAGTNYEMDAIGACFIGGASAYGGIGTVPGVVIGAIFMGVLNNGMSIMGIDANWQKAVKGLVLLAAVAFDVISKKKQSSK